MKKVFFLSITLTFALNLWAQGGTGKFQERMQTQRIAFLSQRLSLTPEEAQQFWPLYNQYTDKLKQIRSATKSNKLQEDKSEADLEKDILAEFDKDARELDLRKEYYQKLKKVISVKKIARLYGAERDFRAELVNRLKENRQERKQLRQGN